MRLTFFLLTAIAATPAKAQQSTPDTSKNASVSGSGAFGLFGHHKKKRDPVESPASVPASPVSPPPNATTYTYDALGRLVQSDVTADGATVTTKIQYDPAGNRTSYTVTGANRAGDDTGDGAAVTRPTGVVVVPLNGFTIIPLDADS